MSATIAPLITLEQAKQLVSHLENGENEAANEILQMSCPPSTDEDESDAAGEMSIADMAAAMEGKDTSELFSEVGKLTRQLHDSLKNFQLDARLSNLATEDIPDAKQRLNYVIDMTEQAANKTMDAVESSLPIADKLNEGISSIKPKWAKLMSRELELGEFKDLCHKLDEFITEAEQDSAQLHLLMTEVLMAQDFQDLTGQVIRRVIELTREVEDSLIHLLTVFGDTDQEKASEVAAEKKIGAADPEGPIMDADTRDDVVSGQDDVDDLLSSLGF
ncbi:protein phosphatase CheZ [Algicola sagamiensis]|uniref:protein phosphatase CheZ n=1 Tax=Algicola sagamiensis TaxID=163869 RepID=UPI00036792F0|nr:protein phosphatase CheZ [Algicola sagamiensis]